MKPHIIKMSPAQYARLVKEYGVASYAGKQAVQYRINKSLPLIGVIKIENLLGRYILTVNIMKIQKTAAFQLKRLIEK